MNFYGAKMYFIFAFRFVKELYMPHIKAFLGVNGLWSRLVLFLNGSVQRVTTPLNTNRNQE